MKYSRKFKIILLSLLVTVSCAQKSVHEPMAAGAPVTQEAVLKKFEEGNKLMDNEQYQDAIEVFESARISQPASTLEGLLLFNTALSYQAMGECKTSYDKFRAVVLASHKSSPQLSVRAKYKMAENLGCLGSDNKAIILLVEVYRQKEMLPMAVGNAEVPARIAALYARIDQDEMAGKYLAVAEKGLQQLGSNISLLAETLFLMGDFSKTSGVNVGWKKHITSYGVYHKYLIRSVLLNQNPWSAKSFLLIQKAFDKMWTDYDSLSEDPKAVDKVMEKRNIKAEKQQLLTMMLAQITKSESLITPKKNMDKIQSELISYLNKEEAKVRMALASSSYGVETTSEADRLNAIKREGKVKSEPTVLEKKSTNKTKKKK